MTSIVEKHTLAVATLTKESEQALKAKIEALTKEHQS